MDLAGLPNEVTSRLNVLGLERLAGFRFAVYLDGDSPISALAGFDKIRDIGDRLDIRDVKEGGCPVMRRYPRRSQANAITLVKGLTWDRRLYEWYEEVSNWGRSATDPDYRRTLSILMLDELHAGGASVPIEVWRWDLLKAWPSEWRGPTLDSMASEFAVEQLVIQHEGMSVPRGILSGKTGQISSYLT